MENGNTYNNCNDNDRNCRDDGSHELVKVIVQGDGYVLNAPEGKAFWLNGAYIGNVLCQNTQYLPKNMKIR